jgi:hypothetical protein
MENKQTAVEWLVNMIYNCSVKIPDDWVKQAKQIEKEQMDKVAGDWWNEGASYMHDGKREYGTFEQYYNETYGTN